MFTPTSDRRAKENFSPVLRQEILGKVIALPITEWNLKEFPGARHLGPVAQDFHANTPDETGLPGRIHITHP